MQFERKIYVRGTPEIDVVEFNDLAHVHRVLYGQFETDSNVFAIEERRFENGATAISLKDKGNKIIIQIKTIV